MAQEKNENFPSALEAFFLVVFLFALEMFAGGVLGDLRRAMGIDSRDAGAIGLLLGNGLLFTALLHYKRMGYGTLFHDSPNSVAATVGMLALPVILVVPGLTVLVMLAEMVITWFLPLSDWQRANFSGAGASSLAMVVMVCILAPFLEEMLFRGIILRSFLRQYTRWRAIGGSALLFGLAHLNIYQFVVGLLLGTLSGWLYERTRSLWPSIMLHGAYNSTVMCIALGAGAQSSDDWSPPVALLVLSIALSLAGFRALRRLLAVPKRAA